MAIPILSHGDVEVGISDEARSVIADVILEWAQFDVAVTQFLLHAFGTSFEAGSILIGNMETRMKLERLKALYAHHGMKEAVQSIANLQSMHQRFVGTRNDIAHSVCVGHLRSKPDFIVFTSGALARGEGNNTASVVTRNLAMMRGAAAFATLAARHFLEAEPPRMRRSKRPPEPPEFPRIPHPSSQKKRERKQKQPRKAPRL